MSLRERGSIDEEVDGCVLCAGADVMSKESQQLLKLLVIGDSGAGKSSMMIRFLDNAFDGKYITTIGVDFKFKNITVDGHAVKLQIWDTAGQERFRTITSTYYRGTHGIITVFDLTSAESFGNVGRWNAEIQQNSDANVALVLVGNKADLTDQRQVPAEKAKALAEQLGVEYFEVSAKSGENIDATFNHVARLALEKKLAQLGRDQKNVVPIAAAPTAKKKSFC